MHARLLGGGVAAVVAIAAIGSAAAAPPEGDGSVVAGGSSIFSPEIVTIEPGGKVAWTKEAGTHNVHFEDGAFDKPSTPSATWSEPGERTFPTAGEYRYYCELHGGPGAAGMSGKVNVTGTPGPTVTPEPTPGPTVTPTPTPGPSPGASAFSVRTVGLACSRRGRRCRRAGVVLEVDLKGSSSAVIGGLLRRRPLRGASSSRRFGMVRFTARPGRRRVRVSRTTAGRRLAAGRYVLDLKAAGRPGPARRLRFRVVVR